MTQYERMVRGLLYDPNDPEIQQKQVPLLQGLQAFNRLGPGENEEKQRYMHAVFAQCGENNYIELPFYANWGGSHLHLGSDIYINFCLTAVDDGHIFIGNKVMFGPNVTVVTAAHPVLPELRCRGLQYNRDVWIGDNAWIGAGAILLPGVHIGENTVIGAGSVVTGDIPENVVAVGNPCRVMRKISERDRQFYYRSEEIDWDNL